MAQDQATVIDKVKRFISLLEENNIPIEQAVLFGSYAHGTADEWSDIDVALVSRKFVGSRIDDRKKIRALKFKVSNDISPLPYRPEDFNSDNPFVCEILNKGIRIT